MTEPFNENVTVHGLPAGIGIGDFNKDYWQRWQPDDSPDQLPDDHDDDHGHERPEAGLTPL